MQDCFPEPLFGFVTNITLNENPEGDQCTLGVDCLSNSTINIVEDGTVNEEGETDESVMNETTDIETNEDEIPEGTLNYDLGHHAYNYIYNEALLFIIL